MCPFLHGAPVKKRFSPSTVAVLRVIFSMSAPHCLESRLPDLRRFSKGSRSALILTKHWVFCPLGWADTNPYIAPGAGIIAAHTVTLLS